MAAEPTFSKEPPREILPNRSAPVPGFQHWPDRTIHTLHNPLHLQISIQLFSRLISSHSCGCPGPQLVPCDRPRVPQSLEPGAKETGGSRFHRLCSSQRHAFELLCEPGAVVSVRQMKLCCRVRPSFVADLFYWLGLFSRRDVEASALFAFKSSNCQRSFLYILAADIPKGFR